MFALTFKHTARPNRHGKPVPHLVIEHNDDGKEFYMAFTAEGLALYVRTILEEALKMQPPFAAPTINGVFEVWQKLLQAKINVDT